MSSECQPKRALVNQVLHLVWHLELRCHSGEMGVGVLNSWDLPDMMKKTQKSAYLQSSELYFHYQAE